MLVGIFSFFQNDDAVNSLWLWRFKKNLGSDHGVHLISFSFRIVFFYTWFFVFFFRIWNRHKHLHFVNTKITNIQCYKIPFVVKLILNCFKLDETTMMWVGFDKIGILPSGCIVIHLEVFANWIIFQREIIIFWPFWCFYNFRNIIILPKVFESNESSVDNAIAATPRSASAPTKMALIPSSKVPADLPFQFWPGGPPLPGS